MAGTLDQHQDSTGSSFGFGEFAQKRYRGQVFTCGISGTLATLGFDRAKGSQGVKVYIDTVSANLPANLLGSELYSWEITNAALTDGYGEYDLPVPPSLTSGTQYCFYIASWNTTTHAYADDYQDAHGVNTGSLEITNNNGTWSNENLTWHYATYMVADLTTSTSTSSTTTSSSTSTTQSTSTSTSSTTTSTSLTSTSTSSTTVSTSTTQSTSTSTTTLATGIGDLAGLTYRCIDSMKLNKDNVTSQKPDMFINRYCQFLANNFNLTHIAISIPLDTDAEFIAAGSTPAPRTIDNLIQTWVDAIHAQGLGVLWRGTFCGIEQDGSSGNGLYGFQWNVGSNRYACGTAASVLNTTFTDFFNRTSIDSNYTTTHGGTDWSLVNNELVSGTPTGGWAGLLLTTIAYDNFTVQAKMKFQSQNIQLAFRTDGTIGYGLQLRTGNVIRLERWGVQSLVEVPKTLTDGLYYQVKVSCSGSTIQARVWEDGTAEPSSWDIDTTDTTYLIGKIGFSSESASQIFDDLLITPVSSTASWLGKIYNFITNNPTYFSDGDLWAILPERTQDIFSDSTSFLPSAPSITNNYADFFNNLKTVSDTAFSSIDKSVITGMSANNYTEVNSGWIPQTLFDTAGLVSYDHYGTAHTTDEMTTDLNAIYTAKGNLPLFHQEWADYWNSALSQGDRTTYLNSMYDLFGTLLAQGKLLGLNYWGGWIDGAGEQILTQTGTDDNPTFGLAFNGTILQSYLADVTITAAPEAPPSAPVTKTQVISGSYTGTGVAGLAITNLGFKPTLVWIWSDTQYAVWSSLVLPADKTLYFTNAAAGFTGGITGFLHNGFTVGTDATVNTNGKTYYYMAFKDTGSGDIKVGSYVGTGASKIITNLGFQPDFVLVKGDTTQSAVYKYTQE